MVSTGYSNEVVSVRSDLYLYPTCVMEMEFCIRFSGGLLERMVERSMWIVRKINSCGSCMGTFPAFIRSSYEFLHVHTEPLFRHIRQYKFTVVAILLHFGCHFFKPVPPPLIALVIFPLPISRNPSMPWLIR